MIPSSPPPPPLSLFILLSIVVLSSVTSTITTQRYEISDIKYPSPKCTINGTLMDNRLGYLTLDNDLLANNLIITYNLTDPFSSCYLCDQYPVYCGTPLSPEYIYLTTNILFNLQVLTLSPNGVAQKVYSFNVESEMGHKRFSSNITIPIDMLQPGEANVSHCQRQYSLIMIGLITIDAVSTKEVVTITHPPIPQNNHYIACRPDPLFTQIGIDCNMVPVLYPILYTVDECVTIEEENIIIDYSSPNLTYYPPLYWYSEMAHNVNNMTAVLPVICGERYDVILFKSGLYQSICYNSVNHQEVIRQSWWTFLFIQLLTLEANIDSTPITLSMRQIIAEGRDLLERNCDKKNYSSISPLILYDKINRLYRRRASINQTDLCLDLMRYFQLNYNRTYEGDFIHLFNLWYIELFKFVVYPDKVVETKVLLSVGLPFFILLFLVFAVGICQFTVKSKLKKTNQKVNIEDPLDIHHDD